MTSHKGTEIRVLAATGVCGSGFREASLEEAVIDRAERIVGIMGPEPYLRALDQGAQVVLADRSSDTAIFAGLLVRAGIPAGIAWHAAKILERGAVYRFCVNHVVQPDDSYEVVPIDYIDVR